MYVFMYKYNFTVIYYYYYFLNNKKKKEKSMKKIRICPIIYNTKNNKLRIPFNEFIQKTIYRKYKLDQNFSKFCIRQKCNISIFN